MESDRNQNGRSGPSVLSLVSTSGRREIHNRSRALEPVCDAHVLKTPIETHARFLFVGIATGMAVTTPSRPANSCRCGCLVEVPLTLIHDGERRMGSTVWLSVRVKGGERTKRNNSSRALRAARRHTVGCEGACDQKQEEIESPVWLPRRLPGQPTVAGVGVKERRDGERVFERERERDI